MIKDLAVFAKKTGVKYFMISYTDLFGVQRAKLVPTQAIADMQVEGAGFAGFATWLDFTPAHPDMLAVPDPSSVIQLPWKPEVAWVAANCVMEGEDVAQAPRNLLKNRGVSLAPKYSHVSAQTDSGGTHIREYMAILDNDFSSSQKDITFPDREDVNSEIAKELSSIFVSKYASNTKTPKIFIGKKNLFISFL